MRLDLNRKYRRLLFYGLCILMINSAYVGAFADPTIFYVLNVFAHLVIGLILGLALIWTAWMASRRYPLVSGLVLLAALLSFVTGLMIFELGGGRTYEWLGALHGIFGAVTFLTLLLAWKFWVGDEKWVTYTWRFLALPMLASAVFYIVAVAWQEFNPDPHERFVQQLDPPIDMAGEGLGKDSFFFPSAAETSTGGLIPSNFFMKPETCGRSGCHPDIYSQWNASAHHFSSFNNQWYRKSIEYMQDVVGVQPSKWCAGCHDHAVFFNGRFDTPAREIVHTDEAQAGLTCTSCHSIVRVKNSMGNGGFVIAYPPLFHLASSDDPILRTMHDFFVRIDPEPHRRTFLKKFHREDTAEFCSTCHKVHLDEPVNAYRWIRGFNDYDAWQASGISGQGARSFYYPPEPKKCADCHMPWVASNDAGNIGGRVHDHRFLGANTALPYVNRDEVQLQKTIEFLQARQLTVDIFGIGLVTRPADPRLPVVTTGPTVSTQFAEVEEMGAAGGIGAPLTDVSRLTAPLDPVQGIVREGESVRVEVVVRSRGVGHFFPGGTVDSFDVWLELKGEDARGRTVFWSGWVEDDGKGPVESGAHRYRSFLLDEQGNHINKRNAWAARSTLYVRLIPPGAADTAHFRLIVPEDTGGTIKLTAKLNYRKFNWWNTQWAFAGVRDPSQGPFPLGKGYDGGRWIFTGDTSDVSGNRKEIPDLPIVVMATDTKTLQVLPKTSGELEPVSVERRDVRERWNDYGIGLLLQGDLRGAEAVFLKVTQMDTGYADGFVNVARCRIQMGDNTGAQQALEHALEIQPNLAKSHYFYALTLKTLGRYDDALSHLATARYHYPRDRAVLNEIGRIYLLQRKYDESITALRKVLEVDPEDLQAHYNLMLAYRGAGRLEESQRAQALYERFKIDEASQAITGEFRRQHPDDNNERQRIHEHNGTWAPSTSRTTPARGISEGTRSNGVR